MWVQLRVLGPTTLTFQCRGLYSDSEGLYIGLGCHVDMGNGKVWLQVYFTRSATINQLYQLPNSASPDTLSLVALWPHPFDTLIVRHAGPFRIWALLKRLNPSSERESALNSDPMTSTPVPTSPKIPLHPRPYFTEDHTPPENPLHARPVSPPVYCLPVLHMIEKMTLQSVTYPVLYYIGVGGFVSWLPKWGSWEIFAFVNNVPLDGRINQFQLFMVVPISAEREKFYDWESGNLLRFNFITCSTPSVLKSCGEEKESRVMPNNIF